MQIGKTYTNISELKERTNLPSDAYITSVEFKPEDQELVLSYVTDEIVDETTSSTDGICLRRTKLEWR